MDLDRTAVATALKKLREEKEMSQQELANMLGKTQQAVDAWERGLAVPAPNMLSRMATIYDVSVDYLLGRTIVRRPIETTAAHMTDIDGELTDTEEASLRAYLAIMRQQAKDKQAKLPPEK